MKNIAALIREGETVLREMEDGRLAVQILLAHVLGCERTALITWPERTVEWEQQQQFYQLLQRRVQHEPIAYIVGEKEFWSQTFKVTPATLIPRPETECLIEVLLDKLDSQPKLIADIGTGSGVIACVLALERPQWHIVAIDIAYDALLVARENARYLKVADRISFVQTSECCSFNSLVFDAIVSNPPYIAHNDPHIQQGDLPFEPKTALIAGKTGYECFENIINSAQKTLKNNGLLAFEHGYDQSTGLADKLKNNHFKQIEGFKDYSNNPRITIGWKGD